ncbi:DNA polymerase III subunit chi [Betaproteobacteria bacterium]|nr:DNA polymerase III subunit chi [Betaproteobacteria bacterium]GHT96175.1 DNA polymerase III subunit chi [Betaproteobacteria bacterium]GHT98256.1 DNA polymerase III subunit chi [Betaproteobacteria bacterium]
MTQAHFYHNTADRLALACELLGNAHQHGRKAAVLCPDADVAHRLDRLLWTAAPGSFIPHVQANSPLASETPIIIGASLSGQTWPHTDILFNLSDTLPTEVGRFRLVIEIVGVSEAERQPARARWVHYKHLQFPLKAFDSERRAAL